MAAAATIPGNGRAARRVWPTRAALALSRPRSLPPTPPPRILYYALDTRTIFSFFLPVPAVPIYSFGPITHDVLTIAPTRHPHPPYYTAAPHPHCNTARVYLHALGERVHLFYYGFALVRRLVRRRFFIRYYYPPYPPPPRNSAPFHRSIAAAAAVVFSDFAPEGRFNNIIIIIINVRLRFKLCRKTTRFYVIIILLFTSRQRAEAAAAALSLYRGYDVHSAFRPSSKIYRRKHNKIILLLFCIICILLFFRLRVLRWV